MIKSLIRFYPILFGVNLIEAVNTAQTQPYQYFQLNLEPNTLTQPEITMVLKKRPMRMWSAVVFIGFLS